MITSSFIDLVTEEISRRREELFRYFNSALEGETLEHLIEMKFKEHWMPLPSASEEELQVIAVDSSYVGRIYAHGRSLHIIRSVAVSSSGDIERDLRVEYNASTRPRTITNLVRMLAEGLEYEVAERLLRRLQQGNVLVLLDGSLYSKLVHVPSEFKVDRNKDAYLTCMDSFLRLCKRASDLGALIVGVAKDSMSEHLRLYLYLEVAHDLLSSMMTKLRVRGENPAMLKTLEAVLKVWSLLPIPQRVAFLRKLVKAQGLGAYVMNELSLLAELITDLGRRESDYHLLMRFAKSEGCSKPLIIGCLRKRCREKFECLNEKGVVKFVEDTWPLTIRELERSPSRLKEFKTWAGRVIMRTKELPAIITFYVLLRKGDIPLRVDIMVPSQDLPKFYSFHNIIEAKVNSGIIERILMMLVKGYADTSVYNIWLFSAHHIVKMSRDEFEALENALRNMGIMLIPRRRMLLV
ncbi:MAG: hypothetical protein DRN15_00170 [Thermoprotei archaeon]|nr:MAG: hypothetical protein DRN15_00170 [Thermoprotei archaeon]RLF25747.1 MAG: hypothetical protein DRM97_00810 [Thermoprotei archaeon]